MTLTRDEIEERKEQLRQEILERECLLAALDVLHKHACGDRTTRPIDVSAFLPALLGSASVALEMRPTGDITATAAVKAERAWGV